MGKAKGKRLKAKGKKAKAKTNSFSPTCHAKDSRTLCE